MSELPPFAQQVTFVYCTDLEATCRFYREVMGLSEVLDQGACRIFRVAGEAFLGLCQGEGPPARGITVTFVVDDVDAWYRHLVAQGVSTEGPPAENPRFKIYNFFARDPAGTRIEVQRFLDPAWPKPGT
ncbi:MAG: VOC family protein [Pseudomonadota bacterium]